MIICPVCEDGEMNLAYTYNSDEQRMELELECRSTTCPARFFGIMYKTEKPIDLEATKKLRKKQAKS